MGRKAFFTAICWLAISNVFGNTSSVKSAVALDNESAESAPRLYRNVPAGIYASAVPYGSYSFHMPTFVAAPHAAASQVVQVKQQVGTPNIGFLKDSYGNRFAETPLTYGYKTAFPQQFLPLQKLPDHLAQPLVSASANFQFKQTSPQVFVGSPYRLPELQGPSPTPINQYHGFSQPLVYADKVKSLAPNAQQQSSNNKAVFASSYQPFSGFKGEPKFQRIQDLPRIVYGEPKYQSIQEIPKLPYGETKFQRLKESPAKVHREEHTFERYEEAPKQHVLNDNAPLQAVPAKKTVTYVSDVNGKTTVVKLKTDPPIPLLDLTLLEPLTFENPLVPQVQHFLPRIHQATYQTLPQAISNVKKQKKPTSQPKINNAPRKTSVTHHETLDEVPEVVSYEINQPNYKETVREKALSYNRETTSAPEHYSYGTKTEKEPVTYSYSRSSKDPENEEIRFEEPHHLIYQLPDEQISEQEDLEDHPEEEEESESQRETSRESPDDAPYQPRPEQYSKESPKSSQHHNDQPRHEQPHHPQQYHEQPQHQKEQQQRHEQSHHKQEHHEHPHHKQEHPEQSHYEQEHHKHPHHKQEHPEQSHYEQEHHKHPHHKQEHLEQSHYEQEHHKHPHHKQEHPEQSHYEQEHHKHPHHKHEHPEQSHYEQEHHKHPHHKQEHHKQLHHEQPHYEQSHYQKHHHEQPHDKQPHHEQSHYQQHHHDQPHHKQEHYEHQHHKQQHHENQHEQPEHLELQHEEPEHHKKQEIQEHQNDQQHQRQETPRDVEVFNSEKNYPPSQQSVQKYEQFQAKPREYEEDIRLAPPSPSAIKVDPNQHVQRAQPTSQPHPSPSPHHEERVSGHSSTPNRHLQPSSQTHSHSHKSPTQNSFEPYSPPESDHRHPPPSHIHEKSKSIIIKEETPESMHMLAEKMREEMIKREENSEDDFEKAYHDAAIGFPNYAKAAEAVEKNIFNPASYGVPPEHLEYNIEHAPFEQYQDQSDEFPKTTRLSYKDARDTTKENYYADYKVSKPESLNDRYKNKEDYYKLYRENKPDYLVDNEQNDKKKQKQKSAKYIAAPSQQKPKSYYGSYKPKQQLYGYDYPKAPLDSSAFASRPHQMYKIKTNFVDPHFQYGFEPLTIPKLLDSELSAMASNLSPESEKPGMRKKIYKENWYIKQTTTTAGDGAR